MDGLPKHIETQKYNRISERLLHEAKESTNPIVAILSIFQRDRNEKIRLIGPEFDRVVCRTGG